MAAAAVAAPIAPGQRYRTERIDQLGVELTMYRGLERIPMQLGVRSTYLMARWQPRDEKLYLGTEKHRRSWTVAVLAFTRPTTEPEPERELEPGSRSLRANRRPFRDFADFMKRTERNRGREKLKSGEPGPARTDYVLWEYVSSTPEFVGTGGGGDYFTRACVYDLPERQVVVVIHVPVEKGKGPRGKARDYVRKIPTSLEVVEEEDESAAKRRDPREKYAVTPAQQKALRAAVENVRDLRNWDYFTTPTHIVLYSWGKDYRRQSDARGYARKLADRVGKALELYQQLFPAYEGFQMPYSVLRVCGDYDTFRSYGHGAPRGVIGWYSRFSKELVMFRETENEIRHGSIQDVLYHEGWHQFSHAYFGVGLHPLFEEGLGDYFAAFRPSGGKWKFKGSPLRKAELSAMVERDDFTELTTLLRYPRFRASKHYAQSYSLMVFVLRGRSLGARPDPAWGEAFEAYWQTVRKTKNSKAALEAAFAQIDVEELEKAWRAWAARRSR